MRPINLICLIIMTPLTLAINACTGLSTVQKRATAAPIQPQQLSDDALNKIEIRRQIGPDEANVMAISPEYLDDLTTQNQAPPLQSPAAPILTPTPKQPQLGPDPYLNILQNAQRAYQDFLQNPQNGSSGSLPRTTNP